MTDRAYYLFCVQRHKPAHSLKMMTNHCFSLGKKAQRAGVGEERVLVKSQGRAHPRPREPRPREPRPRPPWAGVWQQKGEMQAEACMECLIDSFP